MVQLPLQMLYKSIVFHWNILFAFFAGNGKYDSSDVDPDAEAEAVATMCLIATPPEVRAAESKYSKWIASYLFADY